MDTNNSNDYSNVQILWIQVGGIIFEYNYSTNYFAKVNTT